MSNRKHRENRNYQSEKTVNKFAAKIPYILVAVLVATNIWTYYKAPKKEEADKTYKYLNPARKLLNQKDLIIDFQPLRDKLKRFETDPNISIYFEYLPTGANIAVNKDAEFYPASLLKLPVAMAVSKKVEKGKWKWTNELVMMSSDKDENFGDLYKQPLGTRFTIEELVDAAITDSDNTAYLILLRNLEPEEYDDVKKHIGLEKYLNEEGNISAKRYSVILRALYNSSYLNEENSQRLIIMMTEGTFKEFLASPIPSDIPFSHKIGVGEDEKVAADAGIIYVPGRPYLLTVMIKSENKESIKNIMKEISQAVYKYVSEYKE